MERVRPLTAKAGLAGPAEGGLTEERVGKLAAELTGEWATELATELAIRVTAVLAKGRLERASELIPLASRLAALKRTQTRASQGRMSCAGPQEPRSAKENRCSRSQRSSGRSAAW